MRRNGIFIAAVLGTPLAGTLVYYFLALRPMALFFEEKRTMDRLLEQWWEGRPPPGVNEHRWKETWGIAYNGFGNVCFSPEHVSLAEMHRLKADLQAKMHQPATLESLRWLWDRLAETGPSGREYITRMKPLLEEAIRWDTVAPAAGDRP